MEQSIEMDSEHAALFFVLKMMVCPTYVLSQEKTDGQTARHTETQHPARVCVLVLACLQCQRACMSK